MMPSIDTFPSSPASCRPTTVGYLCRKQLNTLRVRTTPTRNWLLLKTALTILHQPTYEGKQHETNTSTTSPRTQQRLQPSGSDLSSRHREWACTQPSQLSAILLV